MLSPAETCLGRPSGTRSTGAASLRPSEALTPVHPHQNCPPERSLPKLPAGSQGTFGVQSHPFSLTLLMICCLSRKGWTSLRGRLVGLSLRSQLPSHPSRQQWWDQAADCSPPIDQTMCCIDAGSKPPVSLRHRSRNFFPILISK